MFGADNYDRINAILKSSFKEENGMIEKVKKIIWLLILCLFICSDCITLNAAEDDNLPTPHSQDSYGRIRKSSLSVTDDGYMRVYYNGQMICIEFYDFNFNLLSKKSVDMELSYWGGFYAGEKYYYIAVGQDNDEEDDTAEVLRIIKYDKNWNRLGAASITGNLQLFDGGVTTVFDHGHAAFTERNGTLYLATGHGGYRLGDGLRHQGLILIAVDTDSMTGEIIRSDLLHSFAQCMAHDEDYVYLAELSDAQKSILLSQYEGSGVDTKTKNTIKALEIGDVSCANLDDMALSADNVFCLGTSVDQTKYGKEENLSYNIYLTVTPKNNFTEESTTLKWITDYNDGYSGYTFRDLHITKINDNRFMIAWTKFGNGEAPESINTYDDILSGAYMHYVFVDGNGDIIGKENTCLSASMTDCRPVLNGTSISYYASDDMNVGFYTIDAYSGEADKKVYRIAGKDAVWDIDGDVLTISGAGKVEYTYQFWPYDIHKKIKKIVFEDGIEEISERSFAHFENLTEVVIPDSVTYIGSEAFFVNSFYSSRHKIVICGNDGSYAEQYANYNKLDFKSPSGNVKVADFIFASYENCDFYKDASGDVRCYDSKGKPVINDFKCDGEYTYYFQADGTAMKDRLTYHPDGIHVIYFDENGHEVFSDFANVKKTIAGEDVNDFCFFDVFGYMYVDVLTYDKTGTVLYYANPYGVMEMGKWFQFSDTVKWADGTSAEGIAGGYGYADADGTLLTNTQTTDWEGRSCYLQGNGVALY